MRAAARLCVAASALCIAACATQIHGGVYTDDGGGADQSAPPDLTPMVDLTPPPPDLTPTKTCGDIMRCMIGCGLQLGTCQAMCFQGAPAQAQAEAVQLIACAAQSRCLGADGGAGNLLFCIAMACPSQIQMCQGLGFGG